MQGANGRDVTADATDGATNPRLRLLVGLVVVSGAFCWAAALADLVARAHHIEIFPVLVTCLLVVANISQFQIRIRASNVRFSTTSAAVLMATAVVPLGWVVLGVAVGVLLACVRDGLP